ncbi:PTS lactose/cellobiose transporter subunit IIA [[Eubacterium] hominis]|uniref:PTS lactose/cellobiose transporter subunit IIA n=1 Tax=[Eubacterium] hominis TaxID=2764325 RepID=UPI003A4E15DB
MEGLELQCFQIISAVGMARSSYIEAIQEAKKGNFEQARDMVAEGEQSFLTGHEAHAKMIQQEASGEKVEPCLLLIHAEDQLMSAEAFKIIAEEMIENYERITALEKSK